METSTINHDTDLRAFFGELLGLTGISKRAWSMDSDISGGYAVLPTQMAGEWIKSKDDYVFVRRYARKFVCENAHQFRAPALNHEAASASWTHELATGTADDTMDIMARNFTPNPLAHKIKISKKLLRASQMDVLGFVIDHLKQKMAEAEEEAFLEGQGHNRPLGIFVQHDSGVTADRWISTGNTTSAIRADNLYYCLESLKEFYRRNARWLFSRAAMRQIHLLKDGSARYLFEPSLQKGDAPRLLGLPVDISEFCPDTFETGLPVGALIDWNCYWIVDALEASVQVLRELYAEDNMDLIIVRNEVDGCCVDENGVAIVTLG